MTKKKRQFVGTVIDIPVQHKTEAIIDRLAIAMKNDNHLIGLPKADPNDISQENSLQDYKMFAQRCVNELRAANSTGILTQEYLRSFIERERGAGRCYTDKTGPYKDSRVAKEIFKDYENSLADNDKPQQVSYNRKDMIWAVESGINLLRGAALPRGSIEVSIPSKNDMAWAIEFKKNFFAHAMPTPKEVTLEGRLPDDNKFQALMIVLKGSVPKLKIHINTTHHKDKTTHKQVEAYYKQYDLFSYHADRLDRRLEQVAEDLKSYSHTVTDEDKRGIQQAQEKEAKDNPIYTKRLGKN